MTVKHQRTSPRKKGRNSLTAGLPNIIELLEQEYGIPERSHHTQPLESLVVTILSQNTNDVNRDRAYRSLRQRFPTWQSLHDAPAHEIAQAIVACPANNSSQQTKAFEVEIAKLPEKWLKHRLIELRLITKEYKNNIKENKK